VTYYTITNQTPALKDCSGAGVNLTTPWQIFAGTFYGTVGKTVSVDLHTPNFTHCFTVALAGPNGTSLNSFRSCGGDAFVPPTHLPFTGTYTVEVLVDGSGTGTGTVTYYIITNQTAS